MNKIGRNIYQIQDARSKNIDKKKRASYRLYDKEQKSTAYERTAVHSDYCDNLLNQAFFSQKNIKIIQNGLNFKKLF